MHGRFLVRSVAFCLALTGVGVVYAAAVSGDAAKQMALTLARGVAYRNDRIESVSAECVYAQWLSEAERSRWVPKVGPGGQLAPSVGMARPPAEQGCWLRLDYETGRLRQESVRLRPGLLPDHLAVSVPSRLQVPAGLLGSEPVYGDFARSYFLLDGERQWMFDNVTNTVLVSWAEGPSSVAEAPVLAECLGLSLGGKPIAQWMAELIQEADAVSVDGLGGPEDAQVSTIETIRSQKGQGDDALETRSSLVVAPAMGYAVKRITVTVADLPGPTWEQTDEVITSGWFRAGEELWMPSEVLVRRYKHQTADEELTCRYCRRIRVFAVDTNPTEANGAFAPSLPLGVSVADSTGTAAEYVEAGGRLREAIEWALRAFADPDLVGPPAQTEWTLQPQ